MNNIALLGEQQSLAFAQGTWRPSIFKVFSDPHKEKDQVANASLVVLINSEDNDEKSRVYVFVEGDAAEMPVQAFLDSARTPRERNIQVDGKQFVVRSIRGEWDGIVTARQHGERPSFALLPEGQSLGEVSDRVLRAAIQAGQRAGLSPEPGPVGVRTWLATWQVPAA